MFKAINRYKVCSGYEAARYVSERLRHAGKPLTDDQFWALRREFGDGGCRGNLDMDVQFYTWEEEKPVGKGPLWRLTFPLFFLCVLIMNFIISPIKWVITGKYNLGKDSHIYAFMIAWCDRCYKR